MTSPIQDRVNRMELAGTIGIVVGCRSDGGLATALVDSNFRQLFPFLDGGQASMGETKFRVGRG